MASSARAHKGQSLIAFPESYVAVDLETTGTSPQWDRIIEIGAIRVVDGRIAETFQKLVNPGFSIDPFIEELTGITNDMLEDADSESAAMNAFLGFISTDDVLVGHNIASFDSNFLYDAGERIGKVVSNDFVDTMRIARKLHKEWDHHRLCDLRERFDITCEGAHRALADAEATHECLQVMRNEAVREYGGVDEFCRAAQARAAASSFDWGEIKPTVTDFDESHLFYKKEVAVTGRVGEGFKQKDVAQAVVNHGGFFADTFKKKTTQILIVGDYSKCRELGGKPSAKHAAALDMQRKGKDITILSPDAFFDLIAQ